MAVAADEDPADNEGAVVVEGRRKDRSDPAEAGESVTVVPLDTRLPPGSDVSDAIARAPGTTVRRLGGLGSYAAVSLRGSAQRQVQIHLDGLPLNPDGSSAINLAALPLAALDRVVVWRGAAAPELAANAMGGVVDLRTKDEDVPLSVGLEGGSWTTGRASIQGGTTLGGVRILGGATALSSKANFVAFDDLGTPDNRTDDRLVRRMGNDRQQASGLVQLRASSPRGPRALTAISVREEGLAGPISLFPIGRLRTLWGLAALGQDLGPASQVRGWGQVRHERVSRDGGGQEDNLFGQVGLHAHSARVGELGRVGISGQARLDVQRGEDPELRPLRAAATAVPYVRWTPTPDIAVEPVLHSQVWLDRGGAENTARLSLNPRVSVRARPHDAWILHTAAGRAIRPPDFLELYGDRGATKGDPKLRPERSLWADLGVRHLAERWSSEATVFASDAVDRIVFVQNGTGTAVPINSDPSSIVGVEAALSTARSHGDARVAATWTEAWVRAGSLRGKRLPRIPRVSVGTDVGVSPVAGLRIGLSGDLVAGNPWNSFNDIIAPPRLLLGADLRFDPGGRWPAAHIGVRNVGDRIAQAGPMNPLDPSGPRALRAVTDFAGYPLPGRTFIAGLTWTPSRREPSP